MRPLSKPLAIQLKQQVVHHPCFCDNCHQFVQVSYMLLLLDCVIDYVIEQNLVCMLQFLHCFLWRINYGMCFQQIEACFYECFLHLYLDFFTWVWSLSKAMPLHLIVTLFMHCLENSLHSSKTLNLHQMDPVIWYWGLIMQIKAQLFWATGSYNTHRLPCRWAQWLETSQVGFGSFLLLWKVSLSQKRLAYNYCREEELIWEFYCIVSLNLWTRLTSAAINRWSRETLEDYGSLWIAIWQCTTMIQLWQYHF